MSRINRAAIVDGEEIEAAPLNTRYADYTQTDINEFNTRDAAIDMRSEERHAAVQADARSRFCL